MSRITIILLFSLLTTALVSQDFRFNNYKKSDLKVDVLDERFTEYQVVDFPFDYSELQKLDGQVIASQFFFDAIIEIDLYPSYLLQSEYKRNIRAKSQSVPMTYFGFDQNTTASLTFNDDFIYGFVRHQDLGEYYIEPVSFYTKGNPNLYVIYKSSDVISSDVKCGVNETAAKQEGLNERVLKASSCEIIQMAIASDVTMYERYGSVEAVENHNVGVMNCVNTNFIDEFDVNIEFEVATQFVSTSDSQDPASNTTNIATVLTEFTNWSAGAPWSNGFDMYQYWTARNLSGGTVGLAFLPGSHHVLEDFSSGASLQALTVHEIGHNFSANHDTSNDNIMFPSVVLTDVWNTPAVNEINNRLSTIAPSLQNCVLDDSPIARINVSNIVICGDGIINLVDKSLYGISRTWSTSGGQISSTSAESITFGSSTPGTYTITLTSTNSLGSDVVTINIEVQADNSSYCTPSNTVFGNGGLASWSIFEGSSLVFSNNSSLAANTGNYENFYCTNTVSLEANTTYTVSYTSVPCDQNVFQYFRLFVDYNNDGDFTDASENVLSSERLWCSGPITQGTMATFINSMGDTITVEETGLIFTTPASPMMNTGLRLRVLVDNSFQSAASTSTCYSPSTGQIEDYQMVFGTLSTCIDGIQNGDEQGIDCGGTQCPSCEICNEIFASNFNQPGPCVYDCNETTSIITSSDPDTLITSSNVLSTSGTINLNGSSPTYWRAENMVEINVNTTISSELNVDVGPCDD